MANIHPTAVIEPRAELHETVTVGPFCYVGPNVNIGAHCRLISHVAVMGRTTLGEHNTIWPQAVLGGDPQDLKYKGEDSQLVIGEHNDIREGVTIHKGTDNDEGVTRVGSHNLIMAYSHIGHDCILNDHIVIANNCQLAGHVLMEDHANIGGSCSVHHFVTIGRFAFVAGTSGVVFDVPPFTIVDGKPAAPRRLNNTLLVRHDFPDEQVDHLKKAFRMLYGRNNDGVHVGRSAEALAQLEAEIGHDENVMYLVEFIRRSSSGVHGRYRESKRRDSVLSNPVR